MDTACSDSGEVKFIPFESTVVTEEISNFAECKLNETASKRKICIDKMKALLKNEEGLSSDTNDEFLLQFLRARKFNCEAAFGLLKNFYRHRRTYPELYADFTPKRCQKLLQANILNYLPLRTPSGSSVWVARYGRWDPDEFSFEELFKFGLICNIQGLRNPLLQICGMVSVLDLEYFSWYHLLRTPFHMIKGFSSAIQDCLPIRHCGIHVVNNPRVFSVLFALIKPLVKEKMRQRIHVHGRDMASLHRHISKDILPEDYGGAAGQFENESFYTALLDNDEYFTRMMQHGYSHARTFDN